MKTKFNTTGTSRVCVGVGSDAERNLFVALAEVYAPSVRMHPALDPQNPRDYFGAKPLRPVLCLHFTGTHPRGVPFFDGTSADPQMRVPEDTDKIIDILQEMEELVKPRIEPVVVDLGGRGVGHVTINPDGTVTAGCQTFEGSVIRRIQKVMGTKPARAPQIRAVRARVGDDLDLLVALCDTYAPGMKMWDGSTVREVFHKVLKGKCGTDCILLKRDSANFSSSCGFHGEKGYYERDLRDCVPSVIRMLKYKHRGGEKVVPLKGGYTAYVERDGVRIDGDTYIRADVDAVVGALDKMAELTQEA